MTTEHATWCDGNDGVVECWDCGGDGTVSQATSDDEFDDVAVRCPTCDGRGSIWCPACKAENDELADRADAASY